MNHFSKSKLLTPNDLQIEWRPLFNLSKIYIDKKSSKGENIRYFATLEQNLTYMIQLCAPYFHPNSGKEILDELLPTMEPLDIGKPESVNSISISISNLSIKLMRLQTFPSNSGH